ncbi:hypothetical protein BGX21_003257, partial [Mortierella sp. AD011]
VNGEVICATLKSEYLGDDVRDQLIYQFNTWKTDKAHQFWLRRRARITAVKTAATLVEGSAPYETEFATQEISRLFHGKRWVCVEIHFGDRVKNFRKTGHTSDVGHVELMRKAVIPGLII